MRAFGRALGRGRDRAREVQRAGRHLQFRHQQAAIVAAPAISADLRIAGKELLVVGRGQRRDIAVKLGVERRARRTIARLGAHRDVALHARLAVGHQRDLGGVIRQRAGARNLGLNGGAAVHLDDIGEKPVAVLVKLQVQRQHAGGVGKACVQQELAARPVHPVDLELGRALAAGKVHRAVDGQHGLLPDDGLAQLDPADLDLVDVHADRQLRQREWRGLGLRRVGGGAVAARQARQDHPLGGKFVDLDAARQQRAAAPAHGAVFQRDPDALVIGDGHAIEGRARTQRAAKAVDLHLPAGAGQFFLQEAGDEALVVLDLLRDFCGAVLRVPAQGQQHRQRQNQKQAGGQIVKFHQNACPRPI